MPEEKPFSDLSTIYGDGVGATMVTTVWARARAANTWPIPDWKDEQAEHVWAKLVAFGARHDHDPETIVLKNFSNAVGTVRRSQVMDAITRRFAAQVGGHFQVVTLGLGLCNRASRLAELDCEWHGIDRPAEIEIRRRLIDNDTVTLHEASVTEPGWLAGIAPDVPTVFIAEGLLMYLTEDDVRQILATIADTMTAQCWFTADCHHSKIIGEQSKALITRKTGAFYKFGCDSAAMMSTLGGPHWFAQSDDDVLGMISPARRAISRAVHALRGVYVYSVKTLTLNPRR